MWATVMKLGMQVVLWTSVTHIVCHHQIHFLNPGTSLAYFVLIGYNNKDKHPEFYMGHSDEIQYVGSAGDNCYPYGVLSPHIEQLICTFALIDYNNKGKFPEFYTRGST